MLVVLDLGNSQTRAIIQKDNTYKVLELPNYFVEFSEDESVILEDNNVFTVKEVNGISSSVIKFPVPVKLATGRTAEIQYYERIERPAFIDKVFQRNTYYSILYSCLNAMNLNGLYAADIELTVLLPLKEVTRFGEELKKSVNGIYRLEWNNKVYSASITVRYILGEDQAAVLAAFFTMEGKLKPEMATYKKGDIIAFDIGAGTTNVVVFKNLTFVEGKKDTYSIGGNTVRELFIEKYDSEYKFTPNIDNAEVACITGWLTQGTKNIDVSHLVNAARKEVARSIETKIKQFLTRVQVNLAEVPLFLYFGGNAICECKDNQGGTLIPIASYLIDLLKPVTPYGVHLIPDNPRLLNAQGGWIYTLMMKKLEKAQ